MLLINVHQLDVVLAQSVCVCALEYQVDHVRRIFSLQCKNILVVCATEHFCQGRQVDPQGNVAIAAERREGFGLEHHGDEGNVRVVHSLERNAGVIAIEVAVLDEILDGVDNLDVVSRWLAMSARLTYLLQQVGLLESGFKH